MRVSQCAIEQGCGFPLDKACLKPGEVVLDLGCGFGADVLKAAEQVGPEGFVFGVDNNQERIALARHRALQANNNRVRFEEGIVEEVPLESNSVDVVVSNCVFNLCTDLAAGFAEAYRVLKLGGRLVFADIVVLTPSVPAEVIQLIAPVFDCRQSPLFVGEYRSLLIASGFRDIEVEEYLRFSLDRIRIRAEKRALLDVLAALEDPAFVCTAHGAVASVYITARKPA